MKNIITMYELIGLIKDDEAPKKIKDPVTDLIYEYNEKEKNYFRKPATDKEISQPYYGLFYDDYDLMFNLDYAVETIPEENDDEWEEIELLMCLDTRETSDCICKIQDKINQLIKNQKHLKEKLENQDENN